MIKINASDIFENEKSINKLVMKRFYHSSISYINENVETTFLQTNQNYSMPDSYDLVYDFKSLPTVIKKIILGFNIEIMSNSIVIIIGISNHSEIEDGFYYINFSEKKVFRYLEMDEPIVGIGEYDVCFFFFVNTAQYIDCNCNRQLLDDTLQLGELINILKQSISSNDQLINCKGNMFAIAKKIGININYFYLINIEKYINSTNRRHGII